MLDLSTETLFSQEESGYLHQSGLPLVVLIVCQRSQRESREKMQER